MSDKAWLPNAIAIINAAIAAFKEATPGPYTVARAGTVTREEMQAYFASATAPHESCDLWQVISDQTATTGQRLCLAMTGNGPKAEANARVLGLSLTATPILLVALERAFADIEEALAALDAGDLATARELLAAQIRGQR